MFSWFQSEVDLARERAIQALHGEVSVLDGPANQQRGWEIVGGWMAMSRNWLAYVPHRINIQRAPLVIARADIREMRPCWIWQLRFLPIPRCLEIETTDGKTFRFVIPNRGKWIDTFRPDW